VLKAYTTRVGGGPFPSELTDATGEFLRRRGNEFGTVTGRPRRCGWLDTVAARYGQLLNGVGAVALTKLDVLDDFEEIRVVVAYEGVERWGCSFPLGAAALGRVTPRWRGFPGWRTPTGGVRRWPDLPAAARSYLEWIEAECGVPIRSVSVGATHEAEVPRS